MKRIITIPIIVVTYLAISVWLYGPLAVGYINADKWLKSNMTGGIDLAPIIKLYQNPLLCYLTVLTNAKILLSWLIITALFTALFISLYFVIKEGTGNIDNQGLKYLKQTGTAGTAKWMSYNEAAKVLKIGPPAGLIFGKKPPGGPYISLPYKTIYNQNVAIFGSPGSMKTVACIRPNIMQLSIDGKSMVITDPKGELYRVHAESLREMGYNVKIFNLVSMINSDRWNPLNEVTDDITAQIFSEVVIANTMSAGKKTGGDPFWDRAEQNLLKALALFTITQFPPQARNMKTLYSLLTGAGENGAILDSMFMALPPTHPAKGPYNIYSQADKKVKTGVTIGLGTRLQVFGNSLVQKLTEVSDIDLEAPGREKCAYFCVISDTNSTFDFISSLFFSFLFIKLIKYADLHGGKCNPDVYFLLDEFPNIGQIPDFTKKISTMRSRGLHCLIVFQSIAQLENRYPQNAWQEIIGNCDTKLFLGCNDIVTAKFVSDNLGISTVESKSISKERGWEGIFDYGRESISAQKRYLLNPDEIMRLNPSRAILIIRGQKPLEIEKAIYTKHPLAKTLKTISEYRPEWAEELLNEPLKEQKPELEINAAIPVDNEPKNHSKTIEKTTEKRPLNQATAQQLKEAAEDQPKTQTAQPQQNNNSKSREENFWI